MDVREFIRINKNVQEAAAQRVTLHNEAGKPFKYYDYKIIEPDEPLGDTLDFSRALIERRADPSLQLEQPPAQMLAELVELLRRYGY